MKNKIFVLFLQLGAISMLIMSIHYFQSNKTGILKGKEVASEIWYLCLLRLHILGGIIAMTTGPFQFIKSLRVRNIILHRRLGYIYFISILLSGSSGLVVAQYAMGGLITRIGFSMLAMIWLWITIGALYFIIRGNIRLHKLYMILSFALTFAAIPQRTLLLSAFVVDVPFMTIYQLSAWLPWIGNIILGLIIFKWSESKQISIVGVRSVD